MYSQRNRSACIRIPITGNNPKAKRIEFRVPDPSANPYLAFSAMLLAGVDGIKNKIEPPEPVDKDLYELAPEERSDIPQVPGSLPEVLQLWKRTTSTYSKATSSPLTCWRRGSIGSARTRSPDPAPSHAPRVRALLRHLAIS